MAETTLRQLEAWYSKQCNGDWEHAYGIGIETLDNPGWSVRIDLTDTELEGQAFEEIMLERSDIDWIHARLADQKFQLHCGPLNLEEALAVFLNWSTAKSRAPC